MVLYVSIGHSWIVECLVCDCIVQSLNDGFDMVTDSPLLFCFQRGTSFPRSTFLRFFPRFYFEIKWSSHSWSEEKQACEVSIFLEIRCRFSWEILTIFWSKMICYNSFIIISFLTFLYKMESSTNVREWI